MPRKKRPIATDAISQPMSEEHEKRGAEDRGPMMAEPPVEPSPGSASSEPAGTEPEASRRQFRSWFVDTRRGYAGLTDEINHLLVLQFSEKPHADVLTAVKGAGFRYKPDHYGLSNVWVRRNDFEGRLQVEGIERLLRSALGEVPEGPSL